MSNSIPDEFTEYLSDLDITRVMYKKIRIMYRNWLELFPELEIKDIFVSEYPDKKGKREFQDLNFFTDDFVLTSENFLIQDNFEIMPIKNRITALEIKKHDYHFKNAEYNSKLLFIATTNFDQYIQCRASQYNCDNLKDILVKYIKPNLIQ